MPASMMSADTGCNAYVVGSSMAMVATGPMPGRTPISVPTSAPINAYMRLNGVSATPNPVARWLIRSIAAGSARPGPDRQLQLEADHEHADGERRQQDGADGSLLEPEFVACRAGEDDEHDRRQHQPEPGDDQPEQHDAAEDDQRRPPFPRRYPRALEAQRPQRQRGAERDQQNAEHAREIARPHAGGGTECILAPDRDRRDPEGDEDQPREEIL